MPNTPHTDHKGPQSKPDTTNNTKGAGSKGDRTSDTSTGVSRGGTEHSSSDNKKSSK